MEENSNAIKFLFRNRKLIILSIFIGGILGMVVTFLIPKKYMSNAIIYPVNSYSKDQLITNPQFGFEVEVEQLMQLLESKSMRDRTIEKFELFDYYGLDTNDPVAKSKLDLRYIDDINIERSKYLSIVIRVNTKSPELSAAIANYQVQEIDNYRASIFADNRKREFEVIENLYKTNENELRVLRDSIYSVKSSNAHLLFNFIENLNNENYNAEEFVDDPALEPLIRRYVFLNNENIELTKNYEKMKIALNKPLPKVYVVDNAEPNYKSTSNSMIINALIGACLLFSLALVTKLFLVKYRELRNSVNE